MISIVIPVYKNLEMVLNNIKHNMPFFQNNEIIIVNDNPVDNVSDFLKEFNNIKVINNYKNLGFGLTVNKGVESASQRYIMLLNSDVLLKNTDYTKGLHYFENDSTLFAVSFAQEETNGDHIGKNRIYWKKGLFSHDKANNLTEGINAWAEAGACIIDKQKFEELHGFDGLYAPFYWEDNDLSYRAWKMGYKILFVPDILVEHHHESTIGKYFTSSKVETIAYRNQLLFTWKNIDNASLLLNHILYLPYYLLYFSLLKRHTEFILGFFSALTKISSIRKMKNIKKTDTEILKMFI